MKIFDIKLPIIKNKKLIKKILKKNAKSTTS